MSIELLLVIAFILLPLIQQLLRASQERQQRQPKPPGRLPPARRPATPGPKSRPQVALPPAPAVPLPLAIVRDVATQTPTRTLRPGIPKAEATARRRRGGERHPGLRRPGEWRNAIVLMTILEPCRALTER